MVLGPPFIHSRMHDRFGLVFGCLGGQGQLAQPAGHRHGGADRADAEQLPPIEVERDMEGS